MFRKILFIFYLFFYFLFSIFYCYNYKIIRNIGYNPIILRLDLKFLNLFINMFKNFYSLLITFFFFVYFLIMFLILIFKFLVIKCICILFKLSKIIFLNFTQIITFLFFSFFSVLNSIFNSKALLYLVGTTDHKTIGRYYVYFGALSAVIGSTLSFLIRLQLMNSDSLIFGLNYQFYNVVITFHGFIMIFMFVMPVLIGGFGNYFLPIGIGSPDMAFPRLNNASF